jgi:hypothetical protein
MATRCAQNDQVEMPNNDSSSVQRLQIVEEHVRLENRHDLDGVMMTFGTAARYEDEPNGEHQFGATEVRRYYSGLFSAMPDLIPFPHQIDLAM